MGKKWRKSCQVAAVYVGTVIGAGFATGRETVEFFSRFGFLGFIGILIGGMIFIYLGSKLMIVSVKIGAKSYQEFNNYLFGKIFGRVINVLMLIMLLGVCAVMLSGAGAVFTEHLGLSKNLGVFVTIFLSIIVMIYGVQGIFTVNSFVVPLIIVVSVYVMFKSIDAPDFMSVFLQVTPQDDSWKTFFLPFSYGALNLGLAQAVLVPVANEVGDEETVKWGGWLGGIILTVVLIANHITLILLPNLTSYDIPMAVIMKEFAPWLYGLFILMIYGEIFTSVIGNVFGLERQLKNYLSVPSLWIVSGIFVICYFVSLIEYGQLLSVLYPLFGYICISFLVLLFLKNDVGDEIG